MRTGYELALGLRNSLLANRKLCRTYRRNFVVE
jgi:hypothetical protein